MTLFDRNLSMSRLAKVARRNHIEDQQLQRTLVNLDKSHRHTQFVITEDQRRVIARFERFVSRSRYCYAKDGTMTSSFGPGEEKYQMFRLSAKQICVEYRPPADNGTHRPTHHIRPHSTPAAATRRAQSAVTSPPRRRNCATALPYTRTSPRATTPVSQLEQLQVGTTRLYTQHQSSSHCDSDSSQSTRSNSPAHKQQQQTTTTTTQRPTQSTTRRLTTTATTRHDVTHSSPPHNDNDDVTADRPASTRSCFRPPPARTCSNKSRDKMLVRHWSLSVARSKSVSRAADGSVVVDYDDDDDEQLRRLHQQMLIQQQQTVTEDCVTRIKEFCCRLDDLQLYTA